LHKYSTVCPTVQSRRRDGRPNIFNAGRHFKIAIPAISLPTKWSNVTRTVARNLNKGVHISSAVLSVMDKPAINLKQDFIGPDCESFGIGLNKLLPEVETSIPSSNVTVEVFHELCVSKNKNNYCWSDVSSWMKKIVPEDLKMKCTPDRMKYLNQKVKKIYQTCMKNRNTDELKEFKSTNF